MHPRENIRKAFVDRLKTAVEGGYPTMADDRVYASRVKPLFDQFFPAILVYTQEETVEEDQWDGDGYAPLKRNLSVDIEAVVKGSETLDDELDLFAFQIEKAFDGWDINMYQSSILRLKKTESSAVIDGSKVYGVIRLTYSLTYRTAVKQPDASGTTPTDITIRENTDAHYYEQG